MPFPGVEVSNPHSENAASGLSEFNSNCPFEPDFSANLCKIAELDV